MYIGIFGGIGSGKSLVLEYLKEKYGAYVLEADKIAHGLYESGQKGSKAVSEICGCGVLDDKGNVDRKALGQLLFLNDSLRKQVNAAIHPLVSEKIKELLEEYRKKEPGGIIVYEAALLPESSKDFDFDFTLYVRSSKENRVKRLLESRKISLERIESIMNVQPSDEEYARFCDYTVNNNGNIEELKKKIDEVVVTYSFIYNIPI